MHTWLTEFILDKGFQNYMLIMLSGKQYLSTPTQAHGCTFPVEGPGVQYWIVLVNLTTSYYLH